MTVNEESQLLLREPAFCTYRPLRVLVCSWNVDACKPDALSGTVENVTFLEDLLRSSSSTSGGDSGGDAGPDVISFGFQEVIDLEDKGLTASEYFLFFGCFSLFCGFFSLPALPLDGRIGASLS